MVFVTKMYKTLLKTSKKDPPPPQKAIFNFYCLLFTGASLLKPSCAFESPRKSVENTIYGAWGSLLKRETAVGLCYS